MPPPDGQPVRPVEALRLTGRTLALLRGVGVVTVDDLLRSTSLAGLFMAAKARSVRSVPWDFQEAPRALRRAGVDEATLDRWREAPVVLPAAFHEWAIRRARPAC